MKGEGLFFPRLPAVSEEISNERDYKKEDQDYDPQKYIEKARKKHAGKTLLIVTSECPEGKKVTIEGGSQDSILVED